MTRLLNLPHNSKENLKRHSDEMLDTMAKTNFRFRALWTVKGKCFFLAITDKGKFFMLRTNLCGLLMGFSSEIRKVSWRTQKKITLINFYKKKKNTADYKNIKLKC